MDCTDIFKGGHGPTTENPVFKVVVCAMTDEAINAYKNSDDEKVDVTLTLNGHELDVRRVFQIMHDTYEKQVADKAKQLVKEKFVDLYDMISDLESRIMPEIDSRLEDWEKTYSLESVALITV